MNEITVGNKIAEGRKARGLSQAEFAGILCISKQAVGKWERGESIPDIIMLSKIAESFGKDLNYFDDTKTEEDADKCAAGNNSEYDEKRTPGYPARKMGLTQWKGADFSGIKNVHEKMGGANVEQCKFTDADLHGVAFKANNINGSDFTRANLADAKFSIANVEGNDFSMSALPGCVFSSSNVDKNNFTGADLTGAIIKGCNFDENIMDGAVLNRTEFAKSNIKKLSFTGEITDCAFVDCVFRKVVFKDVTLRNVFFKGKNMKSVLFENCRADKLTCEFLKAAKADTAEIVLLF